MAGRLPMLLLSLAAFSAVSFLFALQATRRAQAEQEPLLFGVGAHVAPIAAAGRAHSAVAGAGAVATAAGRAGVAADAGGGQAAGLTSASSRRGTTEGAPGAAASKAAAAATGAAAAAGASLGLGSAMAGAADSTASPAGGLCHAEEGAEYDGAGVALWGGNNLVADAAACCSSCAAHRNQTAAALKIDAAGIGGAEGGGAGCFWWVWCGAEGGCGGRARGECWGKTRGVIPVRGEGAARLQALLPTVRSRGQGWTSGGVFTASESSQLAAARAADIATREARRSRHSNPRVYFDIAINGEPAGRIVFSLYATESPRAAENFRAMCTGERGGKYTYTGMRFYRIIDQFIDQAGVHGADSIFGSRFDDDPGGLALRHDTPGLLSAANSGPDSNSGHFSIVVAPAPHLDGSYTIFGEVVEGMSTVLAINRLTTRGTDRVTGDAIVVKAGCLSACDPRPEVRGKCATRATTLTVVQNIQMRKCVD